MTARPPWAGLPAALRGALERLVGFPVVSATSEPGGFSPGVAARVRGAGGERAFVKAVSGAVNPDSPPMHRREAHVVPLLPPLLGSPRLVGAVEDGDWVALAFEEVAGRPPAPPWSGPDLQAALDLLAVLAQTPAPAGLLPLDLSGTFGGWRRLAEGDFALTAWERRHLDRLVDLDGRAEAAAAGDRIVHLDVRSDNLLVREDGAAVLVDWPHAGAGNPLLDLVGFAPSVALDGGPAPWELVRDDSPALLPLVAGIAGYFQERRRHPAPPGIPTVRAFQGAQGDLCLRWLRQLTGWE